MKWPNSSLVGLPVLYVFYRGLERCQAALLPLEAAERATQAKDQAEDAKYQ